MASPSGVQRGGAASLWPGPRRPWPVVAVTLALLAATAFVYRPLLRGEVLAARDAFRCFIPDSAFLVHTLQSGELPLWTPHQRLGQPFAATLHSQAFYPPRVLPALLLGPSLGLSWEQVLHAWLAALGAFLGARALGARPGSAGVAGLAFGLGPLFTQLAIQQNVVASAAWSGFVVAAGVRLRRRPGASSAALLALPLALSFLAGSPETLLWQVPLAAALGLGATGPAPASREQAVRAPSAASVAWGAAGVLWAVLLAAVVALPAVELLLHSSRVDGAATPLAWSVSPLSLVSVALLNADFPRGAYWGEQQQFVPLLFQGTGVVSLALVALGQWRARRAVRLLNAGAGLLALLSLGEHFPPSAFLLELPPFSFFRYPAKYTVGLAFCLCLLSAFGLDALTAWRERTSVSARAPLWSLAVFAGLGGLGPVLARLGGAREGLGQGLLWAGLFLGALVALVLLARDGAVAAKVRWGVTTLVVVELLAAHAVLGMPQWLPARWVDAPSPLASALPRPGPESRLSIDLSGDAPEKVGLAYVAHSRPALVPLRFVEEGLSAVEGYGAPEPRLLEPLLRNAPRAVYDLLGVAHYVRRGAAPFPDLQTVVPPSAALPGLFRSTTAAPRAFVVHRAVHADDAAALEALRDERAKARTTAFLAPGEGEALEDTAHCHSSARLTEARANRLRIQVDVCAKGYLVVSDRWFPGWRARVDGRPAPLHRANLLLRAVPVSPGQREVELEYVPTPFRVGAAGSALGVLALVLVAARSARRAGACALAGGKMQRGPAPPPPPPGTAEPRVDDGAS